MKASQIADETMSQPTPRGFQPRSRIDAAGVGGGLTYGYRCRGSCRQGVRWTVTGAAGTMKSGTEPSWMGVLLLFLHAEPTGVAAWQLAWMNLVE